MKSQGILLEGVGLIKGFLQNPYAKVPQDCGCPGIGVTWEDTDATRCAPMMDVVNVDYLSQEWAGWRGGCI